MADEEHEVIIPRYKVVITYDVLPSSHEGYFRFIMGEMVPALQERGIYLTEAWHTAYGEYPLRMTSFVAEELEAIQDLLDSEEWKEIEDRFMNYVKNYSLSVVSYRHGFQFLAAN
jgi:hypothetical protein